MNAEDIFQLAIDIKTPTERATYVAKACHGDAELLAKVNGLLKAHDEASQFLEQSLFTSTPTIEQMPSESPGTQIGPYKLLQEIGHGGMGVVFMAEQSHPVKRRVALKIIKPGMDSRQVIARFEAERQALSLMDHPNIARVLDAGTTSSGRPYFVMELVKGQPITQYCDEHHMTPRQRLELLLPVCQAIQHAHQKGIIHRDIKPSNILVAEYDNKPVPKVIDFGVAKAIHQPLTDKTMFTGFGNIVGTLEYMSPEQAKVNQLDIDTRSDIYSLGVLMYELLTGSTPFDRKRLKQAAWDEMLRIIREEDPPKPSTRLTDSIDSLPSISAQRHTEPAKLTKMVRGELDWIVMKALDKDRSRRYETANGLAMDLQRYLADEAVSACPPSTGYRFKKFVSRNKGKVLAASIVLAALLLGILGATWGMMQARAERDEKELARQAAEESFQRTRQVVDDFFTLVSQNTIFNVPGLQPVRKDLLEKARDYYQETHQKRPDDSNILAGLASAKFRLAVAYYEISRADDMLKLFAEGLEDVIQLRNQFPNEKLIHVKAAGFWKGLRRTEGYTAPPKDTHHASNVMQRFAKLWTAFIEENPNEPKFQSDRASMHALLGALHAQMLDAVDRQKQFELARTWFDQSIAEWEHLIQLYPKETTYRESLNDTVTAYAAMLTRTGPREDAQKLYERSNQLSKGLAAEYPNVPQYREYLITSVRRNAGQLIKAGKVTEADQEYRRAIQLMEEHVTQQPGTSGYGTTQLNVIRNWIALLKKTGKVKEAEPVIKQLIVNCRNRLESFPEIPNMIREFQNAVVFAAEHAREHSRSEEAEELLLELRALLHTRKPIAGREHEQQEMHGSFLLWQLRPFYESAGRQKERNEVCKEALAIFEKLTQINDSQSWLYWLRVGEVRMMLGKANDALLVLTKSIELKSDHHGPWHSRGDVHSGLNQPDKAIQDYSRAIAIDPSIAWTWRHRAWNYTRLGQWDKAVADYLKAVSMVPDNVQFRTELAAALMKLGKTDEAISTFQKMMEQHPHDHSILHQIGVTLLDAGRKVEALEAFRRAVDLLDNLVTKKPEMRDTLGHYLRYMAFCLDAKTQAREQEQLLRRAVVQFQTISKNTESASKSNYLMYEGDTHRMLGDTLQGLNRQQDAEAAYRQAITCYNAVPAETLANTISDAAWRRSTIDSTFKALIQLLFTSKKQSEAVSLCQEAIRLFEKFSAERPEERYFKDTLEKWRNEKGKLTFITNLHQAIEQDPQNPAKHRELGIHYDKQANLPEALAAFQKVIELEPDKALNHSNLGIILLKLKEPQEAITAFRKAVEIDPKYTRAHHALAEALMNTKDQPGAITAYRKVVELDPKNAGAMNNLAWMLLTADDVKLRNLQEALTLSRKAVDLTKDNWVNLDTHSLAAYRNGHWQESLDSREKMIKLRKPRTEDKFFLAMCYWKLGQKEEAWKYFNEADNEYAKLPKPNSWLTEIKKEAEALINPTTSSTPSAK